MNEVKVRKDEIINQLPPEWAQDLLPVIQKRVQESQRKIFVLDDDPTGTQTVYNVPVLTEWPTQSLVNELAEPAPAAYLLTNSRSLPAGQAQTLNAEIGRALHQAAQQSQCDLAVISRSDSTLRGHFPGEVQSLAEGLQRSFDAWLLVPFFLEGGRYSVDDIHYVAEGDWLVPAGQTEFASDKSFGYQSSNLREWVAEKTGGAVLADQVASISIHDLREGGPAAVTRKLLDLPRGAVCIANAASYRDLEVLVLALLEAEAQGRQYLYRTAASFVRVRAGILPRPLLSPAELALPPVGAGLLIAGSYVPRTSAQLQTLFENNPVERVEVNVSRLLDETQRAEEIHKASASVNAHLQKGSDTAVYTSRALISAAETEKNLSIGKVVSSSLVEIVRGLQCAPRYLIAKGGITSSDTATQGLGIRRAVVLGQILPGVPVWRCGPESRFPGLTYIVFPGNVGGPEAISSIVAQLKVNDPSSGGL